MISVVISVWLYTVAKTDNGTRASSSNRLLLNTHCHESATERSIVVSSGIIGTLQLPCAVESRTKVRRRTRQFLAKRLRPSTVKVLIFHSTIVPAPSAALSFRVPRYRAFRLEKSLRG